MQAFPLQSSLNESIYFEYVPVPTFAGHINRYPFRIVITSSNNNSHTVRLNAKYSKAYDPQLVENKWTFLRPEFNFYDLSGKKIDKINTIDTNLYVDSNGYVNTVTGNFIGVSGYAEFYFVDDFFNYDFAFNDLPYTTIVAELNVQNVNFFDKSVSNHLLVSNTSNSKAIAYQPHIFTYRPPEYIKISENGIRDFINPRWSTIVQPVVFNFNWEKTYQHDYFDGNPISPINPVFNFCKTHPSNIDTDNILIVPGSNRYKPYYIQNNLNNLVVSYKDSNGYLIPGYNKNKFYMPRETVLGILLSATSNFNTPDIYPTSYSPKMWISNPAAGVMNICQYNFPQNYPELDKKLLTTANNFIFNVPITYIADFSKGNFNTIGYHGINSIAVLPPPDYRAWACDGELNYLYLIGTRGDILSAIDLNNLFFTNQLNLLIQNQVSPNSLVLDSQKNMFLTFYDTTYIVKLDSFGNFLNAKDVQQDLGFNIQPNIDQNWYAHNEDDTYTQTQVELQNFIEPTYIDTDSQDNVWVSFSNYANGYVLKYDSNFNLLNTISYPLCSSPQDLIVDQNDNVWIALSNNIYSSIGSLEKRASDGTLLSAFGPIQGVNNLALDINQNIWFTYAYAKLGYINTNTGVISTFNVLDYSSDSKYAPYPEIIPSRNTDDTALEGIACDLKGYVYVINSVENKVYVFNSYSLSCVDSFYVNPQGFVFSNPTELGNTKVDYYQWNKSAQAYGDWMGTRWLNKYNYLYEQDLLSPVSSVPVKINGASVYNISLSGQSRYLDFFAVSSASLLPNFSYLTNTFYSKIDTNYIQDIVVTLAENSEHYYTGNRLDFFIINENFNLAEYIKNISFVPSLAESEYLLNTFLPNIYGSYPFYHSDIGILLYEKISNFVINHNDVDLCNIDQLYSLSDALNGKIDDYRLSYPTPLKRLMNILSVNKNRLWGSPSLAQDNFKQPSSDGVFNRGQYSLSPITYQVSAGVPLVLKTKSLNKYELIQTGPLNVPFSTKQDKITFSLNNIKNIILNNQNAPQTIPKGFVSDNSYLLASQAILTNKQKLQQQIVDYANFYFPYALNNPTLSAKCYRDTGFIIDAIAADIANNTNHRSIEVAKIYFSGALLNGLTSYSGSTIPTLPKDQVDATIKTIGALAFYIVPGNIPIDLPSFTSTGVLSSDDTGMSRQSDVLKRIGEITYILGGGNVKYNPPGKPTITDINLGNLLLSQKEDIQNTVSGYVKLNNLINTYNQTQNDVLLAKCKRDIGFMVDAVANDLITGVDARSIQYGLAYWDGSTSRLPQNILPQQVDNTIKTIEYLNKYMLSFGPVPLVNTTPDNLLYYKLSDLVNYLKLPNDPEGSWVYYYEFYDFIPQTSTIMMDNLIDWQNKQTTLNINLSSYYDWVGQEKFIDKILSYDLYAGLNILPNASIE